MSFGTSVLREECKQEVNPLALDAILRHTTENRVCPVEILRTFDEIISELTDLRHHILYGHVSSSNTLRTEHRFPRVCPQM
jgi:hypothetical protein